MGTTVAGENPDGACRMYGRNQSRKFIAFSSRCVFRKRLQVVYCAKYCTVCTRRFYFENATRLHSMRVNVMIFTLIRRVRHSSRFRRTSKCRRAWCVYILHRISPKSDNKCEKYRLKLIYSRKQIWHSLP